MLADSPEGAFAGPSSDGSLNRSLSKGSDVTRAACSGVGRMADTPDTRFDPIVGA